MNLDKLIKIVTTNTYQYLAENTETITAELRRLRIKTENQPDLLKKILKITNITTNSKTRESYLRSYFRIFQNNIHADGRGGSIIIDITKRCNKQCTHCYSKSIGQHQDMPDDILESIIKFARNHYKHVFLTGGEPPLDPRIFSLAENNPDILFFMFTNGSTITNAYAKRLSSFGNIIPILSIDGSSEAIHDYFKGKGSYQEVMKAIKHLNTHKIAWGYISLVTEHNAHDVLSPEFVKDKIKQGAFLARYIEYLPVGPTPIKKLIPSGETYYLLEKRKKEIIESSPLYMQKITQPKCNGIIHFDVDGNIKNCLCFHYAKYNVKDGDLEELIAKTRNDWSAYNWEGECPIYSDPIGLKDHLEKIGWKCLSSAKEGYLVNQDIAQQMKQTYRRFLQIKKQQGL